MGNAGKYAAGPWHHNPDLSMHGTELVYGNDGYLICDAGRIPVRSQETRAANARLIAAAPALADAIDNYLRNGNRSGNEDVDAVFEAALRSAGVIE